MSRLVVEPRRFFGAMQQYVKIKHGWVKKRAGGAVVRAVFSIAQGGGGSPKFRTWTSPLAFQMEWP